MVVIFPFLNTYPTDKTVFTPVKDISSWDKTGKTEILNSYNNSIIWAVDGFWQNLDSIANKHPDLLVIYTSDHGQNIFDDEKLLPHIVTRAKHLL
ncbi:MAG: hypothetical protein IPO37_12740 [Saprospiraceae bacterium]|nr:hypothetical protein [Saprospiraceae bacterium]